MNGKVTQTLTKFSTGGEEDITDNFSETSELEPLSNLSSSTEREQDTKAINLHRSKRLTETNPIIRLNNPVLSDYRQYR